MLPMTAQSTARTCAVALRRSLDLRLGLGHILVEVRDHARRRDVLDSRMRDEVAVHSAARLRLEDGEAAQGDLVIGPGWNCPAMRCCIAGCAGKRSRASCTLRCRSSTTSSASRSNFSSALNRR